ncbi:class I SAM-dependent methyltransferase [Salibaculum griseiflavum]|uniref:Methyltransferase domain-containing protein n=1 Tax=Salibaculum griseiflavum TaxID=1914409 RepID=A0A2V1P2S1_9RHOB|nr:methyltransferase domain-containing protein [Salibaculum griseiflavum]PWG15697.1 hypothetical protein DFK10_15640 [Salibaculum griseiflavum]
MGFFDFVSDLDAYMDNPKAALRLNKRRDVLIEPFLDEIKGATVLDLGAYDGRWSYAFAGAGAKKVVGIEGRAETAARLADYPDAKLRKTIDMRVGDLFDEIDKAVEAGETYDVIAVFGILYHIMDHLRLFISLRKLKPKLIIVDSEFVQRPGATIHLSREKTDKPLNALPQIAGQHEAVKGVMSFRALEVIAECLDLDLDWSDWDALDDRTGVPDYFRTKGARRATCVMRPRGL